MSAKTMVTTAAYLCVWERRVGGQPQGRQCVIFVPGKFAHIRGKGREERHVVGRRRPSPAFDLRTLYSVSDYIFECPSTLSIVVVAAFESADRFDEDRPAYRGETAELSSSVRGTIYRPRYTMIIYV